MSRDSRTAKRQRVISSVSDTSGISALSTMTQTTDIETDSVENCEDFRCSQTIKRKRSISDVIGETSTSSWTVPKSRTGQELSPRKRQVSWSITDEEVDDVGFYERNSPPSNFSSQNAFRYDNNIQGTSQFPRRVRRATEGCIYEDERLSFLEQRGVPTRRHDGPSVPIRSNTTSQLRGHEEEIQKRLLVEKLIHEHDAKQPALQGRRSQSVTSLSGRNSVNRPFSGDVSHIYAPLGNARSSEHISHDTKVSIDAHDLRYIHPKIELHGTASSNKANSQTTSDSGYEIVSTSKQRSSWKAWFKENCCQKCFYIVFVINVIFVAVNVAVLALIVPKLNFSPPSDTPTPYCTHCGYPQSRDRSDLESAGFNVTSDGRCCLSRDVDLLPALTQLSKYLVNNGIKDFCRQTPCSSTRQIPILQLEAKGLDNNSRIIWNNKEDINTANFIVTNTEVTVAKDGYYFVYSRVHYVKPKTTKEDKGGFSVGHSLRKSDQYESGKVVDKIEQRCFPAGVDEDIRHTSHLGSVQHFNTNDVLYIKLNHPNYFEREYTTLGMFLVN